MAYMVASTSWLEDMERLSDSERGRLFTALLKAARGEMEEPRGSERILFHKLHKTCTENAQNLHNIYISNKSKDSISQPSKESTKDLKRDIEESFERFWSSYPKGYRTNRKRCIDLWWKLKPNEDLVNKMISSIEGWKMTRQWEQGYIPNPDTWLRNEKWNDEIPPAHASQKNPALRYEQKPISEDDFNQLTVDLMEVDDDV